jgi:hypothetical protein
VAGTVPIPIFSAGLSLRHRGRALQSFVNQTEEAIPEVKHPDPEDEAQLAEAALARYDSLGTTAKEAPPESIGPLLDDVMDLDGYLSWLAFNTLVRNGGAHTLPRPLPPVASMVELRWAARVRLTCVISPLRRFVR